MTGLAPCVIVVELTLAAGKPAMAELKPLAARSLADGQDSIDKLWQAQEIASGDLRSRGDLWSLGRNH